MWNSLGEGWHFIQPTVHRFSIYFKRTSNKALLTNWMGGRDERRIYKSRISPKCVILLILNNVLKEKLKITPKQLDTYFYLYLMPILLLWKISI